MLADPTKIETNSKTIKEYQIFLNDIKEGITGFARIIYYNNSSFSAIIEDNDFN